MTGCTTSPTENQSHNDTLLLSAVPAFPAPHVDVVRELKDVCPKDKCNRIYDWFGKLMVLEKQLAVLKGEPTI